MESRSNFEGRCFIISGGSSGIGRAVAQRLCRDGAHVAILGRNEESLAAVAASSGALPFMADVANEKQVEEAYRDVIARFGRLDGLVSNAGIAMAEGLLHAEDIRTVDAIVNTNLKGTLVFLRSGLRCFLEAHVAGAVVCTSSVIAEQAIRGGGTAYAATKGAISAVVRQLAIDYADHGIRINAVAPGATDTPLMWAATPREFVEATRDAVKRAIPLRRLANPDEVAAAITWLLSDEAQYVTGSIVTVDGGVNAASLLPA